MTKSKNNKITEHSTRDIHCNLTDSESKCVLQKLNDNSPSFDTELEYSSPYELVISVVMSAQCTDMIVNRATKELFKHGNTPDYISSLSCEEIEEKIKIVNFFRSKAKHINGLTKLIIEKFNGNIPNSRSDLELLPGVGRKTANILLNILYGQNTIAVDTHVLRVCNRIGISNSNSPLDVENDLQKLTPEHLKKHIHFVLVLHGRYICKAKKPDCNKCSVQEFCKFYKTVSNNGEIIT